MLTENAMTETTKLDEREALSPCPFCGSVNVQYSGGYVECMGDSCRTFGPNGKGVEQATEKWNRRAALATAPEQAGAPNQCDGCRSAAPLTERGIHRYADGSFIACTKSRYTTPPPASTNRLTGERIASRIKELALELDSHVHSGAQMTAAEHSCMSVGGELHDLARAIIAATEGK